MPNKQIGQTVRGRRASQAHASCKPYAAQMFGATCVQVPCQFDGVLSPLRAQTQLPLSQPRANRRRVARVVIIIPNTDNFILEICGGFWCRVRGFDALRIGPRTSYEGIDSAEDFTLSVNNRWSCRLKRLGTGECWNENEWVGRNIIINKAERCWVCIGG